MNYRTLGRTDMDVSILGYGASALGNMFRTVDPVEGRRAVRAALDGGVNYFDVAPAYGGTRAERELGTALEGVPRDSYYLSTKVGKYTELDRPAPSVFDYSRDRIERSLSDSMKHLRTDYLDIVFLHDIEYHNRRYVDQALGEGLETLRRCRRRGLIRAFGVSTYPLDLWKRILSTFDLDVIMTHSHFNLSDTQLTEIVPFAEERGTGVINSSPLAMGLLTSNGPADWHPATAADRQVVQRAIAFCAAHDTTLERVAVAFAVSHPGVATTMTTSASPVRIKQSIDAAATPPDPALVGELAEILRPIHNRDWDFGNTT